MERAQNDCVFAVFLLACLSIFTGLCTSCNALDAVLVSKPSGRKLLQTKKSCPVNFEIKNYTLLTSKCKGPEYPAKQCCAAFEDFACPYADAINDITTDCADAMFSYINLYGKYPPGLFANECTGDHKNGLACNDTTPTPPSGSHGTSGAADSLAGRKPPPLLVLAPTFLLLLKHFI